MQIEENKPQILPPGETEARLIKMMERMWSFSADQLPADEQDLTMAQLRLIDFIGKHAGCHLQEIAEGLRLTAPTVSVAIRKLEEGDWLERRPDPDDGRATCVFLTNRSEKAIKKAAAHQRKLKALFFSGLTESEQKTLLDLLEKGILSLESQISKK
jgi:DNA-binding MarR family transcriptional regulator